MRQEGKFKTPSWEICEELEKITGISSKRWKTDEKIEEEGIISPVTSISCDYKATSTFADVISIEINVKSVKSAKLSFVYHMVNQNGVLVCTAASEHSFLSKNGGFVNLKRDYPTFFNLLKEHSVMQ